MEAGHRARARPAAGIEPGGVGACDQPGRNDPQRRGGGPAGGTGRTGVRRRSAADSAYPCGFLRGGRPVSESFGDCTPRRADSPAAEQRATCRWSESHDCALPVPDPVARRSLNPAMQTMKTAHSKTPLPRRKDAPPNRVPALTLPLCLAILLAAFPATPHIRANIRLAASLWGTAASLLVVLVALRREAGRTRRRLSYRFLPLRVHYVQLGVQFCFYAYWGWYWHKVYQFVPLLAAQIVFVYA